MQCIQYPMELLESRVLLSGSIAGTVTGDPNATVFLDLKGTGSYVDGEPTARVDGSGYYRFTGLAAGKYVVKLEHPVTDNWLTYLPVRGIHAVNLKAGQNFTGADFTHYSAYARGTNDQVFVINGNDPIFVGKFKADGTRDTTFGNLGIVRLPRSADETGYVKTVTIIGRIATITYETGKGIKLDGHGKVLSIISATGQRLPTVDPPVGYTPARPVVGGQISGTTFNDDNFNGVRDPGEPGVAEVRVFLDLKRTGVFAKGDPIVTTDIRGHYVFSRLRSGNLIVRMLPFYGRIMTSSAETGSRGVLVRPGDNLANQDFGILDTFLSSPTALFPGIVTKLATGKLLVGTGNRPSPLFRANTSAGFLTRYNTDGTIDESYGKKGSVEIPFPHPFFGIGNPLGGISGILHEYSDGSVVARSTLGDGFYTNFDLWSLIDSSGHLVRTIGAGGRSHDDLKARGGSMAVTKFTSDGSIIAAGSESTENSFFGNGPDELAVWKFNADLTPDKSFGPFGQKIITNVLNPNVQDIQPLADGGMQVILNGRSPVTISNTGQAILSGDQIVSAPTDFSTTLVGDGEVALQFNDPSTSEDHFVVESGGSIVATIPGTASTGRRIFLVSYPGSSGAPTGYRVSTVNTNYQSDPTSTGSVTFKFNSDVSHNYTEFPDGSFISFFQPDSQNPNLILHSDFKDTAKNFPNVTIAVPPPADVNVSQVLHANRMIALNDGDYLILVQADQSGNGISGPLQYLVRISPAGVIKSTTLVGDLYRANGDNRPGPTIDVLSQTSDGKIMLAGTYGNSTADPSQFYVGRLNGDLSQDQNFGTMIDTAGASLLRGVAVTIDGRISTLQGVGVMDDGTILLSSDDDVYVFNADGSLQQPIAAPADLTVTLTGTNTVHVQLTNNAANASEVVIERKDGQTERWHAINGSGGQIATTLGKPATPGTIAFVDTLYGFGTPGAHTYQYRAFAASDSIRSGDSQTVSLTVTI